MLERVRKRQWNKKNKHRVPATYQEGDWVLVHHSRLPAWPRYLLRALQVSICGWTPYHRAVFSLSRGDPDVSATMMLKTSVGRSWS